MKDFDDLKTLWKKQAEAPLNYKEMLSNVEREQKAYARKLTLQSIFVLLTLALVISIWLFKTFSTWTTHLSMLSLSVCMVYFLIMQFKDYRNVSKVDQHLLKPQEFIAYLQHYKANSHLLNRRNYRVYSFGIGFAFLLILLEMYFILPFWLLLIFTLMTFGWFALSYLFLMKEYIRSEKNRIEQMIDKLEQIKKQLKD